MSSEEQEVRASDHSFDDACSVDEMLAFEEPTQLCASCVNVDFKQILASPSNAIGNRGLAVTEQKTYIDRSMLSVQTHTHA